MLCNNGSENWWYDAKAKPHPRCLEWGFRVTPTGFIQCNTIK